MNGVQLNNGVAPSNMYPQQVMTVPQTPGMVSPYYVNPPGSMVINTNARRPAPGRAEPWEWIILIIVILLIIGVIIWMIWYFGFRAIGKPPGADCSANSDCEVGTYCSAKSVCVPGNGDREGDRCDVNSDCVIGLTCDLDTRVCVRSHSPL